jgi:hypothetical protein
LFFGLVAFALRHRNFFFLQFLDHADVICHDSIVVVDDAIVVVEAVHAKLDEGAKSAKEATLSAMSEISRQLSRLHL